MWCEARRLLPAVGRSASAVEWPRIAALPRGRRNDVREAAVHSVLPTQTCRSGFSKAARRSDRPLSGFASAKQPFIATWARSGHPGQAASRPYAVSVRFTPRLARAIRPKCAKTLKPSREALESPCWRGYC